MKWTFVAEELGRQVPLSSLHPKAVEWMNTQRASRSPWVLAFSGGADSLLLLLLLWVHWPERRGKLIAAHFNHRLRGAESAGDVVFCRRVCRALGIRFETGSWKRKPEERVSEASARAARMAYIEGLMKQERARVLLTGHQQDDVAEMLLMRVARGSGSAGLSAPRPVQSMPKSRIILRPLLTFAKLAVSNILIQSKIPWREDSSNAQGVYFRNRIRQDVLPVWCASAQGRDACAGAALTRELLEEDEAALQAWLDQLEPVVAGPLLLLDKLQGLPKALYRRALHRWLLLTPYRGDLSRQGFEVLLNACERAKSSRFSLGEQGFALLRKRVLSFEPARKAKR